MRTTGFPFSRWSRAASLQDVLVAHHLALGSPGHEGAEPLLVGVVDGLAQVRGERLRRVVDAADERRVGQTRLAGEESRRVLGARERILQVRAVGERRAAEMKREHDGEHDAAPGLSARSVRAPRAAESHSIAMKRIARWP